MAKVAREITLASLKNMLHAAQNRESNDAAAPIEPSLHSWRGDGMPRRGDRVDA